ncbi:MAG: hypothetical protein WKG06_11770 [Segetibacter sp.]
MASSLQSFFQKLLRMFLNAFSRRGGSAPQPYDVPYAMTYNPLKIDAKLLLNPIKYLNHKIK